MTKNDLFIDKINGLITDRKFIFDYLENEDYKQLFGTRAVKAFVDVYGKAEIEGSDCIEDEGFAMLPAFIKSDKTGIEYFAMINVCVMDQGEHYSTFVFFPKHGIIDQQEGMANVLSPFYSEEIMPYHYKPLIKIVGDIHTSAYYAR